METIRTRLNTKQKSSGEYYLDVTTDLQEGNTGDVVIPEESFLYTAKQRAEMHIKYLDALEKAMRDAGKKLVEVKT